MQKEKVEMENQLEQEEEAIVNRLHKQIRQLEHEKKLRMVVMVVL